MSRSRINSFPYSYTPNWIAAFGAWEEKKREKKTGGMGEGGKRERERVERDCVCVSERVREHEREEEGGDGECDGADQKRGDWDQKGGG